MGLPGSKPRSVVASDVLYEVEGAFPSNFNLAHVADVKQSRGGSRRQVFRENAGILHGHIPSAEVDHLRPQASMCGVQCGLSKLSRGWRSHAGFSVWYVKIKINTRLRSVSRKRLFFHEFRARKRQIHERRATGLTL